MVCFAPVRRHCSWHRWSSRGDRFPCSSRICAGSSSWRRGIRDPVVLHGNGRTTYLEFPDESLDLLRAAFRGPRPKNTQNRRAHLATSLLGPRRGRHRGALLVGWTCARIDHVDRSDDGRLSRVLLRSMILATKLAHVPGVVVVAGATAFVAICWIPWSVAHWPTTFRARRGAAWPCSRSCAPLRRSWSSSNS